MSWCAADADSARLASIVATKVRQLPGEAADGLVITTHDHEVTGADLVDALRLLKQRADAKDDAFFAVRGLKDARDFYAHYVRLSGLLVTDEAIVPLRTTWVQNREARRPLPDDAIGRLLSEPALPGDRHAQRIRPRCRNDAHDC